MVRERTLWLGVTIALALVILFLIKCKGNHASPSRVPDTTTVYDTVPVITHDSTDWHPVREVELAHHKQQKTLLVFDTLYVPEIREVDTAAILADYNKLRSYTDTNKVQYGKVIVNNLVKNNRLASQQVTTDFEIPLVTKTETIKVSEKKKGELYFGTNGMFNTGNNLLYVGPSLMFKSKKDRVVEAGVMLNTSGHVSYCAGMKFKLF